MIMMDIHMPEMDGIEATKRIRLSKPRGTLPIIGLTAEAFVERHDKFIEDGMDFVLTKPFTEQQMAATIARYCSSETQLHSEFQSHWGPQSAFEGPLH